MQTRNVNVTLVSQGFTIHILKYIKSLNCSLRLESKLLIKLKGRKAKGKVHPRTGHEGPEGG